MSERDPHEETLTGVSMQFPGRPAGGEPMVLCLALVWSLKEPGRVGEVFCLPRAAVGVPFAIGRAVEPGEDGALPLVLQQLRPFSRVETGPLRDARVSRWQLRVRLVADGGLLVERLGRGGLRINGHDVERAVVRAGDVVEAGGRFALLVCHRPASWPGGPAWFEPFPFAAADRHGIVGESTAAWQLRREIAEVAGRGGHVLVVGPSGSGKELIVGALHARSPRAEGPLVARNAATIPEALIDAELFGNLRDYPNPGMPDRIGLLGEADGGALFLDEVGELSHPLQAHLLRVMDGGEYQRLGEPRRRTCDARIFGATNREPEALKHDLLARFIHRVSVPGLDRRPEDVALLIHHIIGQFADDSPELRARFFVEDRPQLGVELVVALVRRAYTGHVRELVSLLWQAITASRGQVVEVPAAAVVSQPKPQLPEPHAEPAALTREQIVAALAACDGVRELAWRMLRLRSRDQLKRLLKKYEIS